MENLFGGRVGEQVKKEDGARVGSWWWRGKWAWSQRGKYGKSPSLIYRIRAPEEYAKPTLVFLTWDLSFLRPTPPSPSDLNRPVTLPTMDGYVLINISF